MKPITQERMEEALDYLLETDVKCAFLHSQVERAEYAAKRTKSAIFKISEGSVADRNAIAETAPETEAAYEKYFERMREHDEVRNKRATEMIVFEAWRSLNSNRRQGG